MPMIQPIDGSVLLRAMQAGTEDGQRAFDRARQEKARAAAGVIGNWMGRNAKPQGVAGQFGAPQTYGTPGIGDGAADQSVDQAWADLYSADAPTALKLQDMYMARQKDRRSAHQEQLVQMGRLLDGAKDEASYQERLVAAREMGFDVSSAPPSYDPAWVGRQRMIVSAMEKDGEKISGIARELVDAGYQPGTPEFADAMRSVISNKYAAEYVDEKGNTRRRSALNLAPSKGGPQPGVVEDGYRFKGGNPADPNAWEPVSQGGPTPRASGDFRP